MFLSRGDRDLGVAFQTHPGRQAFLSSGSKEPRSALESRRVPARLGVIEAQGRRLGEVQAEVQVQLEQIQVLMAQLRAPQQSFQMIRSARAYRVLRKLGRWKFIEQ